ncbi:MAG: hypothetical protein K0S76_817 [Herbinix sp.]|jgi:uncharacterized protein|nr:hypothetical protein [Herbinix sp.]
MKLSNKERENFINYIQELLQSKEIHEMKKYIQHGNTTTFHHCLLVAYYSYVISHRLPFHFHTKSVARGALLHDFYLYDWHIPDKSHRLHGFIHPGVASKNANQYFNLNKLELNIIESHMWPLTLTKIPKSREALAVCLIDKFCSLAETLYLPILPEDFQDIYKSLPEYEAMK